MDKEKAKKRFFDFAKKQGLSQSDIAQIVGAKNNKVIATTKADKKKGVAKSWLLAFQEKFNLNPFWVETGEGPVFIGENLSNDKRFLEIKEAYEFVNKDRKQQIFDYVMYIKGQQMSESDN